YAVERGLFTGVSETKFDPDGTMTRAMFVTVLGRAAGVDAAAYAGSVFDDVPGGQWYSAYVKWASENGIVTGVGGNKFAPNTSITREEMAVILYRYAQFASVTLKSDAVPPFADAGEISSWATDAVDAMARAGTINGVGEERFAPKNTATRAEVATLLSRFVQEYAS
ncbi:MAG: S-layer homology domain-containing protein, partial [Oscillospiraceae bacterium]|nr:S-layer homology domain-containing protein [Oscillospiraceae bacterium]